MKTTEPHHGYKQCLSAAHPEFERFWFGMSALKRSAKSMKKCIPLVLLAVALISGCREPKPVEQVEPGIPMNANIEVQIRRDWMNTKDLMPIRNDIADDRVSVKGQYRGQIGGFILVWQPKIKNQAVHIPREAVLAIYQDPIN
jgi:hypothetical protein